MRNAIGIYAIIASVIASTELIDSFSSVNTCDAANSSSPSTLPWHQRIFSFKFESTDDEDLEVDITTKGKTSGVDDDKSYEPSKISLGSVETSSLALDSYLYPYGPSGTGILTSSNSIYSPIIFPTSRGTGYSYIDYTNTTFSTSASATETPEIPLTAAESFGDFVYQKGYEAGVEAEFYGKSGFYDGFNQGEVDGYNTGYRNGFRAAQTGSLADAFHEAYLEGENGGYYCGYVDGENNSPFQSSLTYVPSLSIIETSTDSSRITPLPSASFTIQTGLNGPFTFPTITRGISYSYPSLVSVGLEEPPTSSISTMSVSHPLQTFQSPKKTLNDEKKTQELSSYASLSTGTPDRSHCMSEVICSNRLQHIAPSPLPFLSGNDVERFQMIPQSQHLYGSIDQFKNHLSRRGLKETYLEGYKDGSDENSLNIRLKFNPGANIPPINSQLSKFDSSDPIDPSDSSDGSDSSACPSPTSTSQSGQCGCFGQCSGQCSGQCGCSYSSSGGLIPNNAAISPQGYTYQPYFIPPVGYYPQPSYPQGYYAPRNSQCNDGTSPCDGTACGGIFNSLLNYVRPSYWLGKCYSGNDSPSESPRYQQQPYIAPPFPPPPPQPYYYQVPPPVVAQPPPPPPPPQPQLQYFVPVQQRYRVQPAPRYYIKQPQQYQNSIRAVSNDCGASVYDVPSPPVISSNLVSGISASSNGFQTSSEVLSYTYAVEGSGVDNGDSQPTSSYVFGSGAYNTRPVSYSNPTHLSHTHTAAKPTGYASIQTFGSSIPFGTHAISVSPAQISDIDSGSPDVSLASARPSVLSPAETTATRAFNILPKYDIHDSHNSILRVSSSPTEMINDKSPQHTPQSSTLIPSVTTCSSTSLSHNDVEQASLSYLALLREESTTALPIRETSPHPQYSDSIQNETPGTMNAPAHFTSRKLSRSHSYSPPVQTPFESQENPNIGPNSPYPFPEIPSPQFQPLPYPPSPYQPPYPPSQRPSSQRPPMPPPIWYTTDGILPPLPGRPMYNPDFYIPPFFNPQDQPNIPQTERSPVDPRIMETNMIPFQVSIPINSEAAKMDLSEAGETSKLAHVKPQLNLNYENSQILNIFSHSQGKKKQFS